MKLLGVVMCSALAAAFAEAKFQLISPDFKQGEQIPKAFTCEGENKAPTLSWKGFPKATQSFALICDDPDAPQAEPWVHWIVFNIPVSIQKLDASLGRQLQSGELIQGKNTSRNIGYDGPGPPPGKPHRYFFRVYALDTILSLRAGTTKRVLLKAMKGHILGQAELMGTYERK